MSIDHLRVESLLSIVAHCAGHQGKLGSLSNAAMTELMELNAQIKAEDVKKQRQLEAKEAEKREVEAKRVQAETDAQLKAEREAAERARRPGVPRVILGRPSVVDAQAELGLEPEPLPLESYPSDSATATLADNNIDRRV